MSNLKLFLKRGDEPGNLKSILENQDFSEPLEIEIIKEVGGERQSIFQTTITPLSTERPQEALLYSSDEDFENLKDQAQSLEDERAYGPLKVLFPSHAGDDGEENHTLATDVIDGQVLMELHGDRVRTYYDHYQVEATPNLEFECEAMMNDKVDNISLKAGNHSMDNWEFGGYGVSFGEDTVESKVEFNHIDESNNGEKVSRDLDRKIERNVLHGFKYRIQNVQGQRKKILSAWIRYPGETEWTLVMKNRKWSDQEFLENDIHDEGKEDTEELKNGVYRGVLNRCWVRCNMPKDAPDTDAKVYHHKVRISKIEEFNE